MGVGGVTHICNPNHLEGESRKIMVQVHLEQKHKTLSEKQTKSKRIWEHDSSGKALGGPQFNSQYCQKQTNQNSIYLCISPHFPHTESCN
jgi:hypothetical protein